MNLTHLLSESGTKKQREDKVEKCKIKNKKHNKRKKKHKDINATKTERNKKYIKSLSNFDVTTDQTNLLSRGLKFFLRQARMKPH